MKLAINSLHAFNCGPLRDVTIDFASQEASPVTVLAGPNGSGKTTALEIIAALFDLIPHFGHVFAPPGNPLRSASPPDRFRKTERILSRMSYALMDINFDGQEMQVGYSATEPTLEEGREKLLFYPVQPGQLGFHASTHSNTILKFSYQVGNAEREAIPFTFSSKAGSSPSSESLPSILFFPAYRMIPTSQGEQISREDTKYEWVYRYDNPSDFRASLDSFLVWLDYASPEEYDRVIRFLNSLDMGGKQFGVLRTELKGLVTTRNGDQHFLEYLSSGEQHLLIALIQLARRLTPHSIVLIDEMENALHPAFQYLFAEMLTRMQTIVPFQLIVTTHAPAILDAFGSQAVRLLPPS